MIWILIRLRHDIDQAIKCAKKLLTASGDGLIINEKRKIDTKEDIPWKKYKRLDQRKTKHYSGRVGEKTEMMRQFYKAKILIGKEVDKKVAQAEVTSFKPEVDNFVNVVTTENEDKEDSKIILGLSVEIEKVLEHLTKWLHDRIISHAQEPIKRKY